jgi:large subunit ribosomal protein L17
MHKGRKGRKFGRKTGVRKALLVSLSRALILNEKITTTEEKAKELKKFVEPFVTKSKDDSVTTRRFFSRFFDEKAVRKLASSIGPRYKERKGGYTRIIKRMPRKTDSAKMSVIEFV